MPKFAVLVCMAYGLALVVFVAGHPAGCFVEPLRVQRKRGSFWVEHRPSECAASPCSATTRTAGRLGGWHQKRGKMLQRRRATS